MSVRQPADLVVARAQRRRPYVCAARVGRTARQLRAGYGAALWAMAQYLADTNPPISERIGELRREIEREWGFWTAALDRTLGRALLWSSRLEAGRSPGGPRRDPRTCVERHGALA